ncbi:MAG TPA: serine hydrolase [Cyclobacteriaceae bacterium]
MKLIKRIVLVLILISIAYGVYYATQALPILSGYGAKNVCSCVFVGGRDLQSVLENELSGSPLKYGTFSVDFTDSSATGTVLGVAKQKAIYRKGLGCSLIEELSEEEIRNQKINLPVASPLNSDTIPWPQGNLHSDPISAGVNTEKLNQVVTAAFDEPGPKPLRRTRAILVVYNGKIIAEKYATGFTKDSRQLGWSMTKSLTNAMVGILVKQGKLNINDPAPIESWKNDARNKITLNDLMHMSSGLDWKEFYGGPSNATNMLFKKKDMGVYAATVPAKEESGKVFYYSSGTTNIISRIVRDKVGNENYYRFPYEELFHKLGMRSMVIEPDAGGTFVGSSYSFATARDWARFGLLYLNDGVWNGERILPEGWVTYSTTPTSGAALGEYGAQFWLNAGTKGNPEKRIYPSVSTDLYWADGFEGQNVFILPSKKLVIVKLSQSQGNHLNDDQFISGIVEALN